MHLRFLRSLLPRLFFTVLISQLVNVCLVYHKDAVRSPLFDLNLQLQCCYGDVKTVFVGYEQASNAVVCWMFAVQLPAFNTTKLMESSSCQRD